MPEETDLGHMIALLAVIQDFKNSHLVHRLVTEELELSLYSLPEADKAFVRTAAKDRGYAIERARAILS